MTHLLTKVWKEWNAWKSLFRDDYPMGYFPEIFALTLE